MDGRFARALRRLVPALAVLLGANAALSDAGEADISPDVLDELESTICIAAGNWTNSLEEHAKRQSIPVETLSGTISDPARREYLQRRLDATLTAAQQGLIDSHRRQPSEAQRRYRDLVGYEFDLSLCGQSNRRIQRRQAWDAKRREREARSSAYEGRAKAIVRRLDEELRRPALQTIVRDAMQLHEEASAAGHAGFDAGLLLGLLPERVDYWRGQQRMAGRR